MTRRPEKSRSEKGKGMIGKEKYCRRRSQAFAAGSTLEGTTHWGLEGKHTGGGKERKKGGRKIQKKVSVTLLGEGNP